MLQAFVVVFREGFEAFLIVAIIAAYLRKTKQILLMPAVYYGVFASILTSGVLGWLLLQGANQSLWEGISGLVAAVMVTWLVIHMWRTAPHMKKDMEHHLSDATGGKTAKVAFAGVFLFTVLMISREGMETALLLIQIHQGRIVTGILFGILAAASMSYAWARFGHLIDLKRFFQVTAIFLLLFVVQILIYSFHEFTEAGVFPNSEFLHRATEPFSPQGLYGKWFSMLSVAVCAIWLVTVWIKDRGFSNKKLKTIFAFALALTLFAGQAFAHERHFVWTEQYNTLPQNAFELENWVTFKMPSRHATNENTFQFQEQSIRLMHRWLFCYRTTQKLKSREIRFQEKHFCLKNG